MFLYLCLVSYVGYIIYWLYKKIFGEKALTRRTLAEGPLSRSSINYGVELPSILYSAFVVFVYWTIAPIVLVLGALHFGALGIAYKYQVIFVCVPNYEGGGKFWYNLYGYTMAGIMTSVLTVVGYLAIKQGTAQVILTLPLILVVYFAWYYTENEFKTLSTYLPFSDAIAVDARPDDDHGHTPDYSRRSQVKSSSGSASSGESYKEGSNEGPGSAPSDAGTEHKEGYAPVRRMSPSAALESGESSSRPGTPAAGTGSGTDGEEKQSKSVSLDLVLSKVKGVGTGVGKGVTGVGSLLRHGVVMQRALEEYRAPKLNAADFNDKYCYQENMTTDNPIKPYPYRVRGIPLLDERGQMNIVYFSEDPENFGIEDLEAAMTRQQVITSEPEHYPPGAVDFTLDSEGGIAMTNLGFTRGPVAVQTRNPHRVHHHHHRHHMHHHGPGRVVVSPPLPDGSSTVEPSEAGGEGGHKPVRRRSTFLEIQQAAQRDSFSDKDDDDKIKNGLTDSRSIDSYDSFEYEDVTKKVHVVGLEAFRRHAPYPSNEPKVVHKIHHHHHHKKKKSRASSSNQPRPDGAENRLSIDTDTVNRPAQDGNGSETKLERHGSSIIEIEQFLENDEHEDHFSDEEEADTETEDGSIRGIGGASPVRGGQPNGITATNAIRASKPPPPATTPLSRLSGIFSFGSHAAPASTSAAEPASSDPKPPAGTSAHDYQAVAGADKPGTPSPAAQQRRPSSFANLFGLLSHKSADASVDGSAHSDSSPAAGAGSGAAAGPGSAGSGGGDLHHAPTTEDVRAALGDEEAPAAAPSQQQASSGTHTLSPSSNAHH
jgi:hypothetical protein